MSGNVQGADIVIAGLQAYAKGLVERIHAAALEIALLLEEYAKQNHPWQDDTGDTRESIKGQVTDATKDVVLIVLSSGMSYDEFLELAHSGQWAWLHPAVLANQDKIRQILSRVGNGGGGQGASVRRV